MKTVKLGLVSAALLGTLCLAVPEASAMPVSPVIATAAAGADSGLQEARLICGPYRCFRRFGYRRPFVRRFRYHRRPYYRRPLIGRVIRRIL